MRQRITIPTIMLSFIFVTCDKGRDETKTLDFGLFTIEVPKAWKKIDRQGIDSYVGQIAIDEQDTLGFDLGWYSNDLEEEPMYKIQDGKVYLLQDFSSPSRRIYEFIGSVDSVDLNKYIKHKIEWKIIDNKKAKIVTPKVAGHGTTGVFFESLWASGQNADRFQLSAGGLKEKNQKLVIEAIETLKFKRAE